MTRDREVKFQKIFSRVETLVGVVGLLVDWWPLDGETSINRIFTPVLNTNGNWPLHKEWRVNIFSAVLSFFDSLVILFNLRDRFCD